MIFMVAFIVLCILAVKDALALRKLKQRVAVLEFEVRVTHFSPAAPLGQEQDCVTKKE